MPQLRFTVDERTAKRIQREAKRRGLTVSKYLAGIFASEAGDAWPHGYVDSVVGSCTATPLAEPPGLALDAIEIVGMTPQPVDSLRRRS